MRLPRPGGAVASSTAPPVAHPGLLGPIGRIGPAFAAIWLFFLLNPLLAGWALRDSARGVGALAATVAFGAVYMTLWFRGRIARSRLVMNPPLPTAALYLLLLLVLGGLVVALVGEPGLACSVYLAVAFVMVLPLRLSALLVVALTLLVLALGAVEGWGSQADTAFGILAAAVAILGVRTVMSRNIDLLRAQQQNAQLAVENERTRFARDLHDILGHSLTVITVKAELAGRLVDVDLDRTRSELADLERLSRDALADVRRAVEGYRELTLPGELARARAALRTLDIDADLPGSTEDVPTELRELFAWTIREGVTNVIRHSGAAHCTVLLDPTSAEVRDDGRGTGAGAGTGVPAGSGLTGLRERAEAVGATVLTRDLQPGYSLRVARP